MSANCTAYYLSFTFFFFQAEDGIRDDLVTGVQTCALPISMLYVDLGIDLAFSPAAPERLADIEHRSLVALSFPDDDCPAHLEPVQLFAHRLHRYLVGVFAFAIAHRACRGDGCFFRNA